MTDARAQYARHIDEARQAGSRGERATAADAFRAAIAIARGDPALQRDLAAALAQVARLEHELGQPRESERLLRDALDVGDRSGAGEDPSFVAALNEMSRLYIKQSNHARAEMILERLLKIARAKGEDHPEVATALAGIAVAKRGLGDDAAAEQRFRDALRIREKTLAPNNMAIVVTLEQLSETCAARDNLDEALALLQRALSTREAALGAEHATVKSLRSRIAHLEQRIDAAREADAEEALPGKNDLVFIYEPERPARRKPAPPPRERMATPTYSAAVALASLIASTNRIAPPQAPVPSVESAAPAAPPPAAPPASAPPTSAPLTPNRQTAPKGRPSIQTPVADMAIPVSARAAAQPWAKPEVDRSRPVRRRTSTPRRAESAPTPTKSRTMLYALVAASIVALAGAGMTLRARAGVPSADVATTTESETRPAADVAISTPGTIRPPQVLTAASMVAVARADSVRVVSSAPAAPSAVARSEKRAPEPAPEDVAPPLAPVPDGLAAVAVPTIAAANLDSLVGASTKMGRENYTDQITTSAGLVPSASSDDARVRPPVLIGPAPLPRFPDELRSVRTEGEVVVRFRVDERGAVDVSSMKVVRSDHPLFTAAVRRTLPRFRFEPARTAAPESRPRAEWVDFRVEFTSRN